MKSGKLKISLEFLLTIALLAVFLVLNLTHSTVNLENTFYDLLLNVRPTPKEHEDIVLLDFDDNAINAIGTWPVSRAVTADGLILLRELGALYTVFDIEYIDKSPRGINDRVLREQIPEDLSQEFSAIRGNTEDFFRAIQSGAISLEDAGYFLGDLLSLADNSQDRINRRIQDIVRDNDVYLGNAARFFGNSFLTLNMQNEEEPTIEQELKNYFVENIAIQDIDVRFDYPIEANEIVPTIRPVIEGAKGAGFTNVIIDSDGVRRQLYLIYQYKDAYFPQLAFSALYDWMGKPEVILNDNKLILKNADIPDKGVRDVEIPLTEDHSILINWPHKEFLDSFTHISFYELILHNQLYSDLIFNLKAREDWGYLGAYGGDTPLLDVYAYTESLRREILETGSTERITEYIEARDFFLNEVGNYLESEAEEMILGQVNFVLEDETLPDDVRSQYETIRDDVPTFFNNTRRIHADLMRWRTGLRERLDQKFCIIGHTATGTTDIGVNPFAEEYPNVGTHASLVNTIIQLNFLDKYPWYYSFAIALAVALLLTFFSKNLDPKQAILLGVGTFVVVGGILSAIFAFTGIYFQLVTPVFVIFLTFITQSLVKFMRTEQEKSFLRNAFSHYLSGDVINEIIDDPTRLKLGGDKKYLTAIFTDVRGFSTISEQLSPEDLVLLLNNYLTAMSDIILENRGTIDKYEGDAIISFFGAPIDYEDHAYKACLSAVRMKRVEDELNDRFLNDKMAPNPLLTRIGINTGDMVVGNMGTERKMDYTIMGNSVNLAARLEGVNKQYGTWILMSETTQNELDDNFFTRKLDRVRVVGINQPVRLYQLIEEKNHVDSTTAEVVELFHEGLDHFENKDWQRSKKLFDEALKINTGDGPAETFKKRCDAYIKKAPPADWDGVFNLTSK